MRKMCWLFCLFAGIMLVSTGCAPGPRVLTRQYPKLANIYLTNSLTDDQARALARYDLVVLGLENQHNNPRPLQLIRQTNPDCRLLAYVSTNEFPEGSYAKNEDAEGPWHDLRTRFQERHFLRAPNGEYASFWPGTKPYNFTLPEIAVTLVNFVSEEFDWRIWNGVFWDNVWSDVSWYNNGQVDADLDGKPDNMTVFNAQWIYNLNRLMGLSRYRLGPERLIVANESLDNMGQWLINGRLFEGFPNTLGDRSAESLEHLLDLYQKFSRDTCPPSLTIVHTEANPTDSTVVLFGLTFALLSDGYFAVDHGPNSSDIPGDTGWHDRLWWYDEYYQDIGLPLEDSHCQGSHVWTREFQKAVVIWNPNYFAIDAKFSLLDGSSIAVTVAPRTGLIHKKSLMPGSRQ